jgi:hypothetical protein
VLSGGLWCCGPSSMARWPVRPAPLPRGRIEGPRVVIAAEPITVASASGLQGGSEEAASEKEVRERGARQVVKAKRKREAVAVPRRCRRRDDVQAAALDPLLLLAVPSGCAEPVVISHQEGILPTRAGASAFRPGAA